MPHLRDFIISVVVPVAFFGLWLGLALPALAGWRWGRFLLAIPLVAVGILLPLFFFFASTFLSPEGKNVCRFGWVDCFYTGKLALTPLVLFATAAFHAVEIRRVTDRTKPWIVHGYFVGALVSAVCLVFGLAVAGSKDRSSFFFLIVPVYTAIWYGLRARQLIKAAPGGSNQYFWSLLGSVPFWIGSLLWSMATYAKLPDTVPNDCFVVTAAGQGHEQFVGPLVEITRHGRKRRVNRQLQRFWKLESEWQRCAPRSHAFFRRGYNRVGPLIARRIRSPWVADATYVCLKPLEWATLALMSAPVARLVWAIPPRRLLRAMQTVSD